MGLPPLWSRAHFSLLTSVDHDLLQDLADSNKVLLGRLGPEDQRKIRNMLFESVNAINECISFETNFLKGNDAVKQEVQELNARLPRLYGLALQLLCKLLIASHPSWLDSVGKKNMIIYIINPMFTDR